MNKGPECLMFAWMVDQIDVCAWLFDVFLGTDMFGVLLGGDIF